MKKTNREIILEKVFNEGYDIGIYDKFLDKLNKSNLKKVLDNIRYTSDTKVFYNRTAYVVQIDNSIDLEVDFNMISLETYISMFGNWED